MPITKDALKRLRTHYNENKDRLPSQQKIADQAGLSESTVQRALAGQTESIKYETIARIAPIIGMGTEELGINDETVESLDNNDLQALVLALRDMNMRELAAQRKADDERWRERLNADQEKYLARIELLNKQHTDEMIRMKDAHAEEMRRSNAAHEAHVVQIHKMYDGQMESMRAANARQIELMLDGHARQIEAVQDIERAQHEIVQRMADTQKNADEKSKEFLKSEIAQRDSRVAELDARDKENIRRDRTKNMIIFSLIALIFLLFIYDFMMPNMGWIRRMTGVLLSYHTFG